MNYEKGLVSISIVTWNSIEFIEKCLNALINQTYPKTEILVIDNNSDDGTVAYLKKSFPQIKLI